jgi:uncharacterized membrane protein (DUF441 family)
MDLLKNLLSGKKFAAMIIGMVIAIGGKYGLKFDPDLVQEIVGLVIAFIVGQGIADHGKEAAKITAVAALCFQACSRRNGCGV